MKKLFLVIILLLSGFAYADGVASSARASGGTSWPSMQSSKYGTRLSCDLTYGNAGCLEQDSFQSKIPTFEDLDRNYAIHPPRNNDACVPDWNRIKRKKVNATQIQAPLAKLEQSAESVGLKLDALHHALAVYLKNQTKIPQQNYISVVDYDKNGSQPRWHFFDLRTGSVKSFKVSAGKNSDPDHNGIADRFSNDNGTNASSLGCSISGETYSGKHAGSIRLHGLEESNYNNCDRSIVVHKADGYAAGDGRSNGCLAAGSLGDTYSGKRP